MRIPNYQVKLHAIAKAVIFGVLVILVGAMLHGGDITVRALVVAGALLLTAPVSAHALSRIERRLRSDEPPSRSPARDRASR